MINDNREKQAVRIVFESDKKYQVHKADPKKKIEEQKDNLVRERK